MLQCIISIKYLVKIDKVILNNAKIFSFLVVVGVTVSTIITWRLNAFYNKKRDNKMMWQVSIIIFIIIIIIIIIIIKTSSTQVGKTKLFINNFRNPTSTCASKNLEKTQLSEAINGWLHP